jgi:hypothetical protein
MPTPAQFFKHQPHLLDAAFALWESGRYNHFHKAYFISKENLEDATKHEILEKAKVFKFDPDVVQVLGALRGADGKTMRYDESFLNMLQRIDFQLLKISFEDVTFYQDCWFSMKASALAIEVFRLVLTTWLRELSVVLD